MDLIRSLSANEKRYFKLFTATSAGNKNYQKLFAALDSAKVGDKKELKKRLGSTKMNVSYEKAYLQKILMRALRDFHEEASPEIILHRTLIDIEILFNKQNYNLSLSLIKTALPLAEENEHFTMSLQLIKWQRRIMIRKGLYGEISKKNDELTAREDLWLKKLDNLKQYKNIHAKFLGLMAQKGNARQEVEMTDFKTLINTPLLSDEKNALSHGARLLYFECWNWYYQHTLQIEEAYKSSHRMVQYLEDNPDKIRMHPQSYMAALSSLANRCSNAGKYAEALKVIEKMEQMHKIKGVRVLKGLQTEILTYSIERRLMIYGFNREFNKGIEWYEKTKQEVEKNAKALRPTFLCMYNQLAALCYMHVQRYDEALKCLRFLLDEVDNKQRSDTFLYAYLQHVIIHFELKNYQLLPYLVKSVKRFAKTKGFTQESVALFLKMFIDLAKTPAKKEVQQIIKNYQPKFQALNQMNSDSVIMGTIDLDYWMEQKLK